MGDEGWHLQKFSFGLFFTVNVVFALFNFVLLDISFSRPMNVVHLMIGSLNLGIATALSLPLYFVWRRMRHLKEESRFTSENNFTYESKSSLGGKHWDIYRKRL